MAGLKVLSISRVNTDLDEVMQVALAGILEESSPQS